MPKTEIQETHKTFEQPFRFSLRTLLIVFGLSGILLSASLAFRRASEISSTETRIVGGLMQISAAINTQTVNNNDILPSPVLRGEDELPLASWRLKLIGLITSPPTDYDLTMKWDSSCNKPLARSDCWAYCFTANSSGNTVETNVFAITGIGTAFDPTRAVHSSEVCDDAILAMDIADSGVHWMQPGDFDVSQLPKSNCKLGECVKAVIPNRHYVLFADGEIWCISGETPIERIAPFFGLTSALGHTRINELEEYCLEKWTTQGLNSFD